MQIPSLKQQTKQAGIEVVPAPERLWLPLQGYRTVMQPMVKKEQRVLKYQIVAQGQGAFSSCVHAPVSGKIGDMRQIEGQTYLELINDFYEEQMPIGDVDPESLSREELITVIRNSGIVGSGGAGFPTHVKYQVREGSIHTFIINGVECEPYLTADYAVAKRNGQQLLQTIDVLQKLIGAAEIVLAFETQNSDLKKLFEQWKMKMHLPLRCCLVPDSYPQGGELQLIRSVTGKELKKGTLPSSAGIVMSNVGTIYAIYQALFEHHPYIERIITVSGDRASVKGNYRVPIGMPVGDLLHHLNISWNPDQMQVISGGPMMGHKVSGPDCPVSKQSGGILLLDLLASVVSNCIYCGYCVDVCPQRLMPLKFVRYAGNAGKLKDYNISDCILCGACAYSCPAEVPLMENIIHGQQLIHPTKTGTHG